MSDRDEVDERETPHADPDDPARGPAEAGSAGTDGTALDAADGRTGEKAPRAVDEDRSMRAYLLWGGLVVLGVLSVVATAGLYSSLSSIIDVWVGDRYRPIARAVLNFGVLCVAGAGIAVILRRL